MSINSRDLKRQILDGAKGQYFSVTFRKKDGTIREMVAKQWTEKALTYGSGDVQPNPVAHKPEYYTAVCMEKDVFRNINLDTLVKAKVGGVEYEF